MKIAADRLRRAVALARAASSEDEIKLRAERSQLFVVGQRVEPRSQTFVQLTIRAQLAPVGNEHGFGTQGSPRHDSIAASGEELLEALLGRVALVQLDFDAADPEHCILSNASMIPRRQRLRAWKCLDREQLLLAEASTSTFNFEYVTAGMLDGLLPSSHALAALALLATGGHAVEVAETRRARIARIDGRELFVELIERELHR